jgi:glyoxylase-like metal-dependent hydrolase (beta-lactamase superfamily II)
MAAKLELRMRVVGPWSLNAYALACSSTGASVLVDPGDEPDILEEMLAGSTLGAILLTHTHFDHIGALAAIRARRRVPLMLHRGPHADDIQLDADRWLNDGDTVKVGASQLRIYYAPGHTADQICIGIENDPRVIVGDTIFEGGPGKTWGAEDFKTTRHTLREVVLRWPDETVCYPGHGSAFRLGHRRQAIEAFLSKDHGDFFGDATWTM